jgi:hypothetical protein
MKYPKYFFLIFLLSDISTIPSLIFLLFTVESQVRIISGSQSEYFQVDLEHMHVQMILPENFGMLLLKNLRIIEI